jgi:hypothetical protein
VKGHQDDSTKEEELDEWALANILADTNATQELQRGREIIDSDILEGESWRITHNGSPVCKEYRKNIKTTGRIKRDKNTLDQNIQNYPATVQE